METLVITEKSNKTEIMRCLDSLMDNMAVCLQQVQGVMSVSEQMREGYEKEIESLSSALENGLYFISEFHSVARASAMINKAKGSPE